MLNSLYLFYLILKLNGMWAFIFFYKDKYILLTFKLLISYILLFDLRFDWNEYKKHSINLAFL